MSFRFTLPSPFGKSISTFDKDDSFPDVTLVIPPMEKKFQLHAAILSQNSLMFARALKGERCACCQVGADGHRVEWTDEKAANNEMYRTVLVKWLRFCYGEDQLFLVEEFPVALEILSQLQLQNQDDFKTKFQTATENGHKYDEIVQKFKSKHPEIMAGERVEAYPPLKGPGYSYGERKVLCKLLEFNGIPTKDLLFSLRDWSECMAFRNDGDPHRHEYMQALNDALKLNTTLTALEIVSYDDEPQGTVDVCETLKTKTNITKLGIEIIETEEMQAFAELLRVNSALTSINLSGKLTGKRTGILSTVLAANTSITELNLRLCSITDKGGVKLGEALKTNSTLTWLNIAKNYIEEEGGQAIGEGLKTNSSLTYLNISGNDFGAGGGAALGEALKTNTSLTHLKAKRISCQPEGAAKIGEGLKANSSLTKLTLIGSECGRGAIKIAEALATNSKLTFLELSGNSCGPETASKLGQALMSNSTLTFLGLDADEVGDGGSAMLGQGLKKNSTLQGLSLYEDNVGHEGMRVLCDALKVNTSLTALNLGKNSIGRTRSRMLHDALIVNKSLKVLLLQQNEIGNGEAKVLSEALRANKSLTKVELRGNKTGQEGVNALQAVLKANTTLTELNTAVNPDAMDCCIM